MKNQKGVSMITLIITIIVIIILAAIAFVGMDDATGSAQFAGFTSEFGDYANNFQNGPYGNVTEALGLAGKASNKAQKYYAAARGISLSNFDTVLNGVVTPGGFAIKTAEAGKILDATGAKYGTYEDAEGTTVNRFATCYQIKDDIMTEYTNKDFYGDANGEETHWVTSDGLVFTLPGFPRTVDGEERMYINAELYYVTTGGTMIVANSTHMDKTDTVSVEGDLTTKGNQSPKDATDVASLKGLDA